MAINFARIILTSNKAKIVNLLFGTAQYGNHGEW